tara:strand:- start:253 stop:474 length:222 start_codon:yes stop_codon:yes gene_type:complete
MEQLKSQAPDNIDNDTLLKIYNKNNSNIVDTLSELWNIVEHKNTLNEKQEKWANIRQICDDIDIAKYEFLNKK